MPTRETEIISEPFAMKHDTGGERACADRGDAPKSAANSDDRVVCVHVNLSFEPVVA